MTDDAENKLRELCLNILAHHAIDSEVTIDGNGVDSSEAFTVAQAVMKRTGIKVAKKDLNKLVKELKVNYGLNE